MSFCFLLRRIKMCQFLWHPPNKTFCASKFGHDPEPTLPNYLTTSFPNSSLHRKIKVTKQSTPGFLLFMFRDSYWKPSENCPWCPSSGHSWFPLDRKFTLGSSLSSWQQWVGGRCVGDRARGSITRVSANLAGDRIGHFLCSHCRRRPPGPHSQLVYHARTAGKTRLQGPI